MTDDKRMPFFCASAVRMLRKLDNLDLFSGIGGMSYALRDILKPIAYCEINPLCVSVLDSCFARKLLDKAPIYPDVRLLKGKELKRQPVIVTAGFPCQDISAGNPKGNGIDGSRSGLVRHVFRLIDECPSIRGVFLENSPFIVTRGLEFLLREFADRGFQTSWVILGAQDVGGLHLRKRWWCLARRPGLKIRKSTAELPIDWKREPCQRLVPRTCERYKDNNACNCIFGNAIVPQCAQRAFNALNMESVQDMLVKKGVLRLQLSDGKSTFHRASWPTPNASHWYQYRSLTLRSTRMLSNCIFYERQTAQEAMSRHSSCDPNNLDKCWMVNPSFVAWLMGYPDRWLHILGLNC